MKKVLLVVLALSFMLLGCSLQRQHYQQPTPTKAPVPTETQLSKSVGAPRTPVGSEVLDETVLANAFTRCVVAEGLWLRSKPWSQASVVIPDALLAGTKVQVYLSPSGTSEWLEVWVPSKGVGGYVNIKYIGNCE